MSQFGNDDPFAQSPKRPSISFRDASIGTVISGKVVEAPKLVQARDFESGEPAFWDDGNPKMTVVVGLEVNGEERNLWAPKPSALFTAIGEAQQAAGKRLDVGDILHVKFVEERPNEKNPRLNPQKIYAAKIEAGDVFAQAAPQAAPAQAPAAASDFGPDEAPF